jgi:heptosyltransferase-2
LRAALILLLFCFDFLELIIFFVLIFFLKLFKKKINTQNEILVIRVDNKLGDMVIFSDFLRKLYLYFPNNKISIIIHKSQLNLLKYCPYIYKIYPYDFGDSRFLSFYFRSLKSFIFIIRNNLFRNWRYVISNRYDSDPYSPFLAGFSGGDKRVGYVNKLYSYGAGSFNYLSKFFIYNRHIAAKNIQHEAEKNLATFHLLGISDYDPLVRYESWVSPTIKSVLSKKFSLSSGDKIICLGIGAADRKRIWPTDYFCSLIKMLDSQGKFKFFLMGGNDSISNALKIMNFSCNNKIFSIYNTTGDFSINDSAGLLQLCDVFVGNDSGLLHLACANVKNVIEISCHSSKGDPGHPNSPFRFGPKALNGIVLQPRIATYPCKDFCSESNAHCILAIKPIDVFTEILGLL